jgi:integrase
MTTQATSRITFLFLISLINNSNYSKAKKQDMASALRTIAKVLGVELSELIADPGLLRRRLDMVSPQAVGISSRRWANIRTLLARALELARPIMSSRSYVEISPAWLALMKDWGRSSQDRMKPLLRYLSEQVIAPSDVTLEILLSYRDAILNDRLRARAEKTWDSLIWLWNKCARSQLGWPQLEIPRENKRETYTLDWSPFPSSLKEEVDRFIERQTGRDLSDDGPPKPWRETSCQTRIYQLRVAASILVLAGITPEEITSISVLVRFENYQKILRYLYDRRGQQTSSQIAHLASFLKDVARHWVKVDEGELKRLKNLASRLAVPRQGMTAKNRERLRPLDDPEKVQAFLGLAYRIYSEMDKKRGSARHKAVLAQIAIAILLLQTAPIRIKNLAQIDIRKHLISRGDRLYLVFDGSDVKNSEPIDFELPDNVVEMLAWYIREHRPILIKEPSNALFPGQKHAAKTKGLLGEQISKTVFRYTGMKFNPHLFRHAGGKLFLDIRPGEYEVVRRVLGHRSLATTTSIYTGAETRSACQHFVSTITQRLDAKKSQTDRSKKNLSRQTSLLLKPKGGKS